MFNGPERLTESNGIHNSEMINTILGSKGINSQTFIEGFRIPVTKVIAGPCVVTQIKKTDKDGYWAVQLGFSTKRSKNTSKPLQGHLKKSKNEELKTNSFPRYLREVRTDKEPEYKVGDTINASDIFHPGDIVSVMGISKGKGFAGVVKRHGFHGGPRTHGQSDRERAPGSIGQTTTPGRVYRGKKMAGRMGGEQVTVENLHIIAINVDTNELEISGQIPGTVGSLVTINKIKSGSLKELEHEVVAQMVEGEGEAPASAEATAGKPADQGKPTEAPVDQGGAK
ncbi:MAG: 50S ribosomal protein L3 [Candidatus Woesebacteria bacterium GW2011_GWB1_39_10]|uniref:Large ribosomal subunit protein uL3 n=2 Tax=Candidatus Woeseibacteriota TaxID=1752722 RepID=A0A0G0PRR5_9BACT|nr:MAG: 50S ribosomal protein L3 [Candidatus Woesebacteria bacterium GW2011_GWB1_39_10]KKS91021.1 MAG: 50S ribosomal protein L3 [Candidatus Woesebacteria bacterium GW2011_GWA1_43_12]